MKKLNVDLIYFKSTDGFELQGILNKNEKQNKKLIIHLHGMGGDCYRGNLTRNLITSTENTSYDFFSINTRGMGLENKFYGKKKKLIGTANEKVEECIYDIDGAIQTGKKLGYKKFILSGHSTGCQKVTYYQGKKQNKLIQGIILLSPCDDHNLAKKDYGKDFNKHLKKAKKLLKDGNGNKKFEIQNNNYSVKRWLSFADNKNVEAQLFNYDGKMKFFSKIKKPILTTFGSKDFFANHNAKESIEILKNNTKSDIFISAIIKGAEHSYKDKEKEVVKVIEEFLKLF